MAFNLEEVVKNIQEGKPHKDIVKDTGIQSSVLTAFKMIMRHFNLYDKYAVVNKQTEKVKAMRNDGYSLTTISRILKISYGKVKYLSDR